MMIIGKNKKRRIAIRLGYLWFWIKSLSPTYFDMATEIFCNLCSDLDVEWELVQKASTRLAEVMSHRKKVTDNE